MGINASVKFVQTEISVLSISFITHSGEFVLHSLNGNVYLLF